MNLGEKKFFNRTDTQSTKVKENISETVNFVDKRCHCE